MPMSRVVGILLLVGIEMGLGGGAEGCLSIVPPIMAPDDQIFHFHMM